MAKEERGRGKGQSPQESFPLQQLPPQHHSPVLIFQAQRVLLKPHFFTQIICVESSLWFAIPPNPDSPFLPHNFLISVKFLKVLAMKNKPENMSSGEIQVTETTGWEEVGGGETKQTKTKPKQKNAKQANKKPKPKNLRNPKNKPVKKGKRFSYFEKRSRNKKSEGSRIPTGVSPLHSTQQRPWAEGQVGAGLLSVRELPALQGGIWLPALAHIQMAQLTPESANIAWRRFYMWYCIYS